MAEWLKVHAACVKRKREKKKTCSLAIGYGYCAQWAIAEVG